MPAAHDNIALMKKYLRKGILYTYGGLVERIVLLVFSHLISKYPDKMAVYTKTNGEDLPDWEWSKGVVKEIERLIIQDFRSLLRKGARAVVVVRGNGLYDIIETPEEYLKFVRSLDDKTTRDMAPETRWFARRFNKW